MTYINARLTATIPLRRFFPPRFAYAARSRFRREPRDASSVTVELSSLANCRHFPQSSGAIKDGFERNDRIRSNGGAASLQKGRRSFGAVARRYTLEHANLIRAFTEPLPRDRETSIFVEARGILGHLLAGNCIPMFAEECRLYRRDGGDRFDGLPSIARDLFAISRTWLSFPPREHQVSRNTVRSTDSPDNRMPAIFGDSGAENHDQNSLGSCRYACKFDQRGTSPEMVEETLRNAGIGVIAALGSSSLN